MMKKLVLAVAMLALVASPVLADPATHVVGGQSIAPPAARDPVIYDNGLDYVGMAASQFDTVYDLEPILADDFMLTAPNTIVTDVHWIGGYWNGDALPFDWEITFYADAAPFGAGPAAIIYQELFANANTNETWIEDTANGSHFYSYDVTLAAPLDLVAGTTYWMSAQGIGDFPPQSGFAYHTDPITGSEAYFKSVYFGVPDWVPGNTVFGQQIDACFQLTGIPEPASLVLLTLAGLLIRRR
ncbi:MAG: hypothetical protein ABIG44_17695 [Planctomycetota bacterium]